MFGENYLFNKIKENPDLLKLTCRFSLVFSWRKGV